MSAIRRFMPRWLQPSDLAVITAYFWAWTLWYALVKHQSFRAAELSALQYALTFGAGWVGMNLLHPVVARHYRSWRLRRPMRSNPTPPQNVRLSLASGTEIPVECVYAGKRGEIHEWKAVTLIKLSERELTTASIRCDMLPSRTCVVLEVEPSPSGLGEPR